MKKKRLKRKSGISPVIATVLLVAMVVVIALIIFLWFRGMTEETITKFGGTNVKLICQEVQFAASYNNNVLALSNTGNVPIFGMKLKIFKTAEGSHDTQDLRDISENWPLIGLGQGGTFSENIGSVGITSEDEVILIPVLMGSSEKGDKSHICDEKYGREIVV
jgi:flagellin-like protein